MPPMCQYSAIDGLANDWHRPAFLVPTAARVRRDAGLLTGCSWLITEPAQAEEIVQEEQLDVVVLARAMLDDPHWPYHAARALGLPEPHKLLPPQYHRVSTLPR